MAKSERCLSVRSSKNVNFIFSCCKKKPLNGYYVCTKCSGVFHTSCSLQTKSFTHLNDHKIVCKNCNISNETNIDVYPKDEEIEDLKREVQSQSDTITKMHLEHKLFYDEAIEMENNFLKEREHLQINIFELEVVIKTLRDKETIESGRPVFVDANTQTSVKTVESEKTVKQRVDNASTQTAISLHCCQSQIFLPKLLSQNTG
ncbi:hypothetical protein JTB14_007271 [Gonioctena quinquepunctata]|nr:hypothetical protein JTB14_007271 [Gonioctena quinquepunctata]